MPQLIRMLSLESEKSLIEKGKGVLSGDTGGSYKTEKEKAKLPRYRDQEEIVLDDEVFYTWGSIDARYATTSKVIYPTTSETAIMIPMKAIRQSPEYVPEEFGEEEYNTPGPVDLSSSVFLIPSQKVSSVRKELAHLFKVPEEDPKVERALHRVIFFDRNLSVSEVFDFLTQNSVGQEILSRKLSEIAKLNKERQSGAEEEFLQGLTPVVIGTGMEERYPPLAGLRHIPGLKVVFLEGQSMEEAVARLVGMDARGAVFAGIEEESGRFARLAAVAGIERVRHVAPDRPDFTGFLLAVIAEAAGAEESAVAARKGFGNWVDAVATYAGQV